MEKLMDLGRMDNYYEQIVKKRFTPGRLFSLIMYLGGIVLVIFTCFFLGGIDEKFGFLIPISLILLAFGIWLAYYIIKNSGVEYEYTFVLGEMRIERIKGKSKRRKITAFDIKAIDDIGRYLDLETGNRNVDPSKFPLVLRAEENEIFTNTYYVVIHDKIRHQPALLLFSPNETTLEKLRPFLSIELKKKYIQIKKENDELAEKREREAAAKKAQAKEK